MAVRQIDTVEPSSDVDDVHDASGVDRSLIRWMLALTPTERLAAAEELANLASSVKRGDQVR